MVALVLIYDDPVELGDLAQEEFMVRALSETLAWLLAPLQAEVWP